MPHVKWGHLQKLAKVLPAPIYSRIADIYYRGADHYTIDMYLPHDRMSWSTHFLNGLDAASVTLFLLEVP
jgi:hypothetical protein